MVLPAFHITSVCGFGQVCGNGAGFPNTDRQTDRQTDRNGQAHTYRRNLPDLLNKMIPKMGLVRVPDWSPLQLGQSIVEAGPSPSHLGQSNVELVRVPDWSPSQLGKSNVELVRVPDWSPSQHGQSNVGLVGWPGRPTHYSHEYNFLIGDSYMYTYHMSTHLTNLLQLYVHIYHMSTHLTNL